MNPDEVKQKKWKWSSYLCKILKGCRIYSKKDFILSTVGGDVHITYLNERGDQTESIYGQSYVLSQEIPVAGTNREVINEPMEFAGNEYFVTCASIGNPHCVIWLEQISKELVCQLGPFVENAEQFRIESIYSLCR